MTTTDDELDRYITHIFAVIDEYGTNIEAREEIKELINTQKRLYAESVIGEYSQYPSHFNISDVLAEQRARIK